MARLNVRADELATQGLRLQDTTDIKIPGLAAKIYIQKKLVSSYISKTLHYTYHSIQIREYMIQKYKWSEKIVDNIWWEIHGKQMQTLSPQQQTIIHKYIHNKLPCNKNQNRYYQYCSDKCYVCEKEIECQIHVLRCKECSQRNKTRKNYLVNLKRYLEATRTNTTTIRVLIHYIGSWLNQTECAPIEEIAPEASPTLKMAINHQTKLGWEQWFYGRLSIHWGKMYDYDNTHRTEILRDMNTRSITTVKWGKSIIEMGWHFLIETWLH